jgi:hypothetical protein
MVVAENFKYGQETGRGKSLINFITNFLNALALYLKLKTIMKLALLDLKKHNRIMKALKDFILA